MVDQAAAELDGDAVSDLGGQDSAEAAAEDTGAASASRVRLDARYSFDYDDPLPHLSSPRAPAYAASDTRFSTRALFALVLERGLPHRGNVLASLRGQAAQGGLGIAATAPFTVPGSGERRLAIVLERPEGGRLWPSISSPAPPLSEAEIAERVVPPIATALGDLNHRHITHGAIRPDNLFYADENRRYVALGECVTEPPGLSQPVAYETIDRGLAMPLARDEGLPSCDLYSFGVTVLALLLGADPAGERDDDELLRVKIVEGSYSAYVGDLRLSITIQNLLKGLLCDDAQERWTAEDVLEWCDNPRANAKRSPKPQRAPQPFIFDSKEYYDTRTLAMDLSRNAGGALDAIGEGKLEKWLRGDVRDAVAGELVGHVSEQRQGNDDETLAEICVILDPDGPIRYKGLSVVPGGLGPLLADNFADNDTERRKAIAELIASDLPARWMEARQQSADESTPMPRQISEIKKHVGKQAPGHGLERCLYDLNPSLPCLSPLVDADFVLSPNDLLPALDAAVASGRAADNVLDRHVTAFVASRRPQSARSLNRLAAKGGSEAERRLAELALLADLQRRDTERSVPNLSAWFATRLDSIVGGFHSRVRRQEIGAKLKAQADKGNLASMYALLDQSAMLERDKSDFAAAKKEAAAAKREMESLVNGSSRRAEAAIEQGHRFAFVVASLILALAASYLMIAGAP